MEVDGTTCLVFGEQVIQWALPSTSVLVSRSVAVLQLLGNESCMIAVVQ